MNEPEDNFAGTDQPVSETERLHKANRDLQEQVAAMRQELDAAQAAARLMRESRWWRLGLALRNRRNILFALRHPIWALKTLAGLRTRRGRGKRGGDDSFKTGRQWLAGISTSPRIPEDLWIASILDDDLRVALAPDCRLVGFRPDNWQVTLEAGHPHLLLVESAERGNEGSWEYRIGATPHADYAGLQDLRSVVDWCRANGTPTVFWLTAPASQAERFVEAASLFDHVVATEATAAARLQRTGELRAPEVLVVPEGVQPAQHSPIGSLLASDTCTVISAAPSGETADALVGAAQTFGLTVYATAASEIPVNLSEHAVVVDPRARESATAQHAVYVNREGTGLPTRALQAIAAGAVVVSVPNPILEEEFGKAVAFARTTEEAKEAIERLLTDDRHRAEVRASGLRTLLSVHTIRQRIASIARTAGFDLDEQSDARVAALVLADELPEAARVARTLAAHQHPPAQIIIGTRATDTDDGALGLQEDAIRVVQQDPVMSSRDRWRTLAALATAPWVAPIESRSAADPAEVRDLLLAQRFARADVLGRGPSFAFTDQLDPGYAVARREIVAARGWPVEPGWTREGVRIFTVPR